MRISQKKIWSKKEKEKGEKNRKKGKREIEKHEILVQKSDCSCAEHKIWFVYGEIFWGRISKEILVEVMKAYELWCNQFLRRIIGSVLRKKAAAPYRVRKGPDQSCVNHRWRTSTLESHGGLKITKSWSSHWYMTSDLFLLRMFLIVWL